MHIESNTSWIQSTGPPSGAKAGSYPGSTSKSAGGWGAYRTDRASATIRPSMTKRSSTPSGVKQAMCTSVSSIQDQSMQGSKMLVELSGPSTRRRWRLASHRRRSIITGRPGCAIQYVMSTSWAGAVSGCSSCACNVEGRIAHASSKSHHTIAWATAFMPPLRWPSTKDALNRTRPLTCSGRWRPAPALSGRRRRGNERGEKVSAGANETEGWLRPPFLFQRGLDITPS